MTILSNFMEIAIAQIPIIIGITWKAASEKAAVYRAIEAVYRTIDSVKDAHEKQISLLDKNLSLLTQESQSGRASLEEKLSGQGRRFGSKFERLEGRIEDAIDFKCILAELKDMKGR